MEEAVAAMAAVAVAVFMNSLLDIDSTIASMECVTRFTSTFFGFAEFGDDGEVFEGGGVALDFAVGGELAQQAAHDFAAAGFGQGFGEANVVGAGERADFFRDPLAEFVFEFFAGLDCRFRA